MNARVLRILVILIAGLTWMPVLAGSIPDFRQPAVRVADVVAFIGNEVIDLTWDPVPTERYEVTRNGGVSECFPIAHPDIQKIYCRETGLTDGETYAYKVEAITDEKRTLIGEKSVTMGFVKGTLYESLEWMTPGETYSLDGRVLVTNGAVLKLGKNVHVDKVVPPSEAAGIETEGTGGLQVISLGTPSTSFDGIYLRLGADSDWISGADNNLVTLTDVSMHLTNDALIKYCFFTKGSIVIVEEGGVPSFTASRFANVPIAIKATSTPVIFDSDRFGDPILGDFWVDDGGRVTISDSLFAASSGTGLEVGTNGVATITGNTFHITSSTGVHVWPDVGAEVTVSGNVFSNTNEWSWMNAILASPGTRHPYATTNRASSILVEDNIFTGRAVAVSLREGEGVSLEARYNSMMNGSAGFEIIADADLGDITIRDNCIVGAKGIFLNSKSDVKGD